MTPNILNAADWNVVGPYLDKALLLEVNDRDRWLSEIAITSLGLAELLRELLREHDGLNKREFLGGVAVGAKTLTGLYAAALSRESSLSSRGSWESEFRPGLEIANYRLVRELGQGGMSTVWLAERTDGALKREIALKLAFIHPQNSALAERFHRERDIHARLTHPNIARLYDAGVSVSGQPYLAMEYVQGTALTAYCDRASLSPRQRISLFVQVLETVQYAHSQLILHRDLKPSNILVTPQGRIVLLDFGVAKTLDEKVDAEAPLTAVNGRPITLDYASPEQIRGESLSTATDIYSLGVILYELLSGVRPHRPARASRAALEEAILSDDPFRMSQLQFSEDVSVARGSYPRSLAQQLKGDLDTIALKALRKAPADRYATVSDFMHDLLNYLGKLPVRARPDRASYRLSKFISRYRWQAVAATVATLALVIGSALALWQAKSAARERDRAVLFSKRNYSINTFLEGLITDAAGASKPIAIDEMIGLSERWTTANARGDPDGRAAILFTIGGYYQSRGDYENASRVLSQALDLTKTSQDHSLRSEITCFADFVSAKRGNYAQSMAALDAEIARLGERDDQLGCLTVGAYLAQDTDDPPKALRYSLAALDQIRGESLQGTGEEAEVLGAVARGYYLTGDLDSADRYFRRSIDVYTASGLDASASAATVRNNWAIMSGAIGRPRQELEQYQETLHILQRRDPSVAPPPYLLVNIAHALRELGRLEEVPSYIEQALRLARQSNDTLSELYALLEDALTAETEGRYEHAGERLKEITDQVAPMKLPEDSTVVQRMRLIRGNIELAGGRLQSAEAEFATGASRANQDLLLAHAEVELTMGNTAVAQSEARLALETAISKQGKFECSNHTGLAWLMLARVHQKTGSSNSARREVELAIRHLSGTVDESHPALVRARQMLATM